jgi:hypothetical protein
MSAGRKFRRRSRHAVRCDCCGGPCTASDHVHVVALDDGPVAVCCECFAIACHLAGLHGDAGVFDPLAASKARHPAFGNAPRWN